MKFAEFTYSYHHGDVYVPYIKQDEPLKVQCRHFVECIREGIQPITGGPEGLQIVRILEAASRSMRKNGASVPLVNGSDSKGAEVADEISGSMQAAHAAVLA